MRLIKIFFILLLTEGQIIFSVVQSLHHALDLQKHLHHWDYRRALRKEIQRIDKTV